MKNLLLAILLLTGIRAAAQNSNNYIQVYTNQSLSWSLNTQSEIENDQTIYNAIRIRVKNRSSQRSVYARLYSYSGPPGFSFPGSPLQLDYIYDNSNYETSLITTPLTLTTTDQRLFTHRRYHANKVYDFNYSLILKATDWTYAPGNYSFTILFTFTQP